MGGFGGLVVVLRAPVRTLHCMPLRIFGDEVPRSRTATPGQVTTWPRHIAKVSNLGCVAHTLPVHCSMGQLQGQMRMGPLTPILVL